LKTTLIVLALISITASAYAGSSYVTIVEPFNATATANSSVFLGKVGPGQAFYITVSSATAYPNGTKVAYGWNKLSVEGVPQSWVVENSSLNNQLLAALIKTAPTAANGTYSFNVTAVNIGNYSRLGSVTFRAIVNVTPDVFKLDVSPSNISTGPAEPATIYVTINNTGVSDSPFVIAMQGLPGFSQQNLTRSVIALHHTSRTYSYPIYENEPGTYNINVNVSSSSSPLVYERSNVTFLVDASVQNDYAAIGQGGLLFPPIYEPVYAVMHLISLLFGK
jgi:hypothetical protein